MSSHRQKQYPNKGVKNTSHFSKQLVLLFHVVDRLSSPCLPPDERKVTARRTVRIFYYWLPDEKESRKDIEKSNSTTCRADIVVVCHNHFVSSEQDTWEAHRHGSTIRSWNGVSWHLIPVVKSEDNVRGSTIRSCEGHLSLPRGTNSVKRIGSKYLRCSSNTACKSNPKWLQRNSPSRIVGKIHSRHLSKVLKIFSNEIRQIYFPDRINWCLEEQINLHGSPSEACF